MTPNNTPTAWHPTHAPSPPLQTSITSTAFQKNQAHLWAFHQWRNHYNASLPLRQHSKLPGRFVYTHTLTCPPDGQTNHPLWQACLECTPNPGGTPMTLPCFTRCTTSTAIQVAIDHAFTGVTSTTDVA